MKDNVPAVLSDQICQLLTFCYSSGPKLTLVAEAEQLQATYEQVVAMALTEMILERFHVAPREASN
jgi:hypothetical protein